MMIDLAVQRAGQTSKFAASLLPVIAMLACSQESQPVRDTTAADSATVDTSVRPQPARVPWADARRRGVDFRAIGQEPGWMLEIDKEKSIYLLADYGEKKVTLPAVAPRDSAGTLRYDASDDRHRLTILIRREVCHDAMSGEEMTHTVIVTFNGTEYRGCGRDLTSG